MAVGPLRDSIRMVSLKFAQHLQGGTLEDSLPLRGNDAVAVFLGKSLVHALGGRGTVVDVAVRVTSDEDVRIFGCSFYSQANLDGKFTRKRHQLEVTNPQSTQFDIDGPNC